MSLQSSNFIYVIYIVFMSLEQLKENYILTNKDFFSYLQLCDFIRANQKGDCNLPLTSPVEHLCHVGQPLFRTISRLYTALMSTLSVPDLDRSKVKWEKDLGIPIDEQLWRNLCRDGVTSRYKLIQFNFLHQLSITPHKLHKFNSSTLALCFRCGTEEGTFLHSTCQCSNLQGICETLSKIHRITFPLDPEICLLGKFTNSDLETNYAKKLKEILLTIVKKCIATKWKSGAPLPIEMCQCEINSCMPLEKIIYWMQKRSRTFCKIWQPFLICMENLPAHRVD